ncbi:hypothetical protein M426DRAFT_158825 [Hypoxylon sp. CI-4A]|nr:hypothetical protein M426DRAFT_158825 [Hypoxylon sp. CI-4A]
MKRTEPNRHSRTDSNLFPVADPRAMDHEMHMLCHQILHLSQGGKSGQGNSEIVTGEMCHRAMPTFAVYLFEYPAYKGGRPVDGGISEKGVCCDACHREGIPETTYWPAVKPRRAKLLFVAALWGSSFKPYQDVTLWPPSRGFSIQTQHETMLHS